jgi:HSP20 family protein
MSLRELIPWRRDGRSVTVRSGASPIPTPRELRPRVEPFERWFADFERAFGGQAPAATCWSSAMAAFPRVDVVDAGDALHVSAEVPGVAREDLEVSLERGALVLRGEKREARPRGAQDGPQNGWYRAERSFGSFERAVPLPCEVEPAGIEARLEHGVLRVTLAKNERARQRSRRIEIGRG